MKSAEISSALQHEGRRTALRERAAVRSRPSGPHDDALAPYALITEQQIHRRPTHGHTAHMELLLRKHAQTPITP